MWCFVVRVTWHDTNALQCKNRCEMSIQDFRFDFTITMEETIGFQQSNTP